MGTMQLADSGDACRYGVHGKVHFDSANTNPFHRKILENLQCEMYQTVLHAARRSYQPAVLREWENETREHQRANVQLICDLINASK